MNLLNFKDGNGKTYQLITAIILNNYILLNCDGVDGEICSLKIAINLKEEITQLNFNKANRTTYYLKIAIILNVEMNKLRFNEANRKNVSQREPRVSLIPQ